MTIDEMNRLLRNYFLVGETKDVDFRKARLRDLLSAVEEYEEKLYEALQTDLNKSRDEAFFTEISIVKDEIRYALRHVKGWARDKHVCGSIAVMPSRSYIHYEPLGTALIIAPWNYPVNLLLCPLVASIAAGCCAMLKPSPYTPNVSRVLTEMIKKTFPMQYINIVEGHREVNEELLEQRWDLIFFTGSPALGKVVMAAAAKNLTPCILELGGKSPCIVDKEADLKMAARRIAWGKLLNNGQTCIAPDYLLVQNQVADKFMHLLDEAIEDISENNQIVKIVNDKARARLESYEKEPERQWEEEIFGPMFPMRTFGSLEDAELYVNNHEKPLALYYFGDEEKAKRVIKHTSSGGVVVNDTIIHIANPNLPFGGVGNSGMGRYHRKAGFLSFSNPKSVLVAKNHPLWMRMKEVPFRKSKLVKWLMGGK